MLRLDSKRTGWGTAALCLLALCAVLLIGVRIISEVPLGISGRVVSASTGAPVPDALVAIESVTAQAVDDPGLHEYVRTDGGGRFKARVRGVASFKAWKPGYAMRSIQLGEAWKLKWREITVELRELSADNLVEEFTNRNGLKPGEGLVLRSGEIVSADSPAADIWLLKDSGSDAPVVEAAGEGGLLFQPYENGTDYYNTPEAPASGYLKRFLLPESMGLFYVKTKDGRHYAKIRFIPGGGAAADGRHNYSYWSQWSYQPDGTRYLEVAPSKAMPFPFHRFGLNTSLLVGATSEGTKSR